MSKWHILGWYILISFSNKQYLFKVYSLGWLGGSAGYKRLPAFAQVRLDES